MLDSELKEDVTSTQHMELVIRFLKRAGQNLSPPFRVEIPSRRLSQADQKRILAKELCDFLHLYNKETVLQYQNQIYSPIEIDNHLFENFLRSASEADLEQMMTAYMKNNKNSAIHLGVNPKNNKINNQQGSDVGADQQAQTILPKQSIEDKTITLIQTISSNEQSNQKWATVTTQNDPQKRLLRASSASRQRNHKRHDDIYKLYGVSRPVSAVVQHRKRIFN
jgi:tubulin polyglutamylase TTLL5